MYKESWHVIARSLGKILFPGISYWLPRGNLSNTQLKRRLLRFVMIDNPFTCDIDLLVSSQLSTDYGTQTHGHS